MTASDTLLVRRLGSQDYRRCWQRMLDFTDSRGSDDRDELWLLQHPAVFTQGQAGKAEHLLAPGAIPVIQADRGGQVTYHGPGQLVAYVLVDLRRRHLGVRELVTRLEQTLVDTLAHYDIDGFARAQAPGVYVGSVGAPRKIGSLGLRVRRGCSFHGLSLNVDMDLSPFARINPCGYAGMKMTQIKDMVDIDRELDFMQVERYIIEHFINRMGYIDSVYLDG
ncbi:lipoyl(octanoyl) transferase LipB [Exilibacterium tricleocarpae]|uniref:Octanoyltransferase n=1 Tax=Exilibacterium tricleocarpae TaxID=2591008 RepID=A0A545STH4_9GAMM|nr:lipoyl(octanoyl) transferase LipB [Exilibacterium tricleocarpae]TQV68258.1 lipoyl(octanoyl) transferase LipB [Exilibacterium tricleocarpae]